MNAKDRRLSLQYSVFQFGYWVDYLIAFFFGAVLLAGRGIQPTEIGYVTTIGALLTIVLQSGLSTLADRSEKITVRGILTCLILGCAAVAVLLVLSVCAFSEMPAVFLGVPLLKRLTAARMLRISALSGLLKFGLMLVIPNVTWLIVLGVLHFFYTGFYSVSSIFYVNSIASEKDAVKAQGFLSVGVTGLVGILANLAGGYLLEHTTIQVILWVGVAVEAVCAVLMFLSTSKRLFKE